MGEHHFGTGTGRIEPSVGERIDEVARRSGARFIWANVPGQGPICWFACESQGFPLDGMTERDVWADLEAEGLAGPAGLLPCCFRDG